MTISTAGAPDALNSRLAWLLSLGSWASCVLITAGMVLPMLSVSARSGAEHLVSAGIVLLIALPTIRVGAMSVWFLFNRDLDFALIAGLVLSVIVASTLLGVGAGERVSATDEMREVAPGTDSVASHEYIKGLLLRDIARVDEVRRAHSCATEPIDYINDEAARRDCREVSARKRL